MCYKMNWIKFCKLTSALILIFPMIFASGCSQQIEYVTPDYAPLADNIAKANPKPQVTEANFKKWKDSLKLLKEIDVWGTKESNRANACVIIYQKTISNKEDKYEM